MSKGSPHINVRVPRDLLARIEAQAGREQVTVTSLVVNALRYWTQDVLTVTDDGNPAPQPDARLARRKALGHQ